MRIAALTGALALIFSAGAASAETISTHVLDLARGVGGRDVPVTLSIKQADGAWRSLATARTDENGESAPSATDSRARLRSIS
jgi:5-hydroxyisourate hydrolase